MCTEVGLQPGVFCHATQNDRALVLAAEKVASGIGYQLLNGKLVLGNKKQTDVIRSGSAASLEKKPLNNHMLLNSRQNFIFCTM